MKHGTFIKTALSVSALLMLSAGAHAQAVTITQKGKAFSETNLTLAPGQEVVFVNDDDVAHNVYAVVKGKKEDLGLQKPTEQGSIVFEEAGTYRVRCAIHPKMKLVVKVQ